MSAAARSAALCATALLLAGCGYDYHQRSNRLSYRAGDAVRANLERETINPFRDSVFDTSGLGKDGSGLTPPYNPSSTSTGTPPADGGP